MSNIVVPIAGFGKYPDGRLRAGPFPIRDIGVLDRMLAGYAIYPAAPGDTGFVSLTADGVMISAAGEGVRGYFLGKDGLEADRSDLDEFLMAVLPPGASVQIGGHWSPDPDCTIVSNARALRLEDWVDWSERRDIHHRDGRVTQILPRAGERPRLVSLR